MAVLLEKEREFVVVTSRRVVMLHWVLRPGNKSTSGT